MFKDAALTWYYAAKTENNNQAPHWDNLKQKLINHFEPPACQNEMRSLLDKITFHGDMDLYVRLFQGVEIQIPVTSMMLDDRKYRFMDGLPQDLSMQLFRQQDTSMATVYTTARHWASLQKVARGGDHPPVRFRNLKRSRPAPTPFPHHPTTVPSTVTSAPPTTHVEPMDLDVMASSRNPQQIPMHPRCYNCNGYGHIARDCRKDSRRPVPGLQCARERSVRPEQLHLFEEGEIPEGPEGTEEPELQYPERGRSETALPIVPARTTIHYPQPQYPVPEFMGEEPLFTDNLWHRLEAEERGRLQTVEEADEDITLDQV